MEVFKNKTSMVHKYYQQETDLPQELLRSLQYSWGDQNVVLFAFVDLDSRFQLTNQWLIIGETHLVLAKPQKNNWNFQLVEIAKIKKIHEQNGLSYQKFMFLDELENILLSVNFSLRQARVMNSLKFFLEQKIKSPEEVFSPHNFSAQKVYVEQLLEPIVEAQSSVTGTQTDVVWRLIGLLKPYKKSVMLGMMGAILMTLVSLLPAYLTGYIIDEVVKPFQSGKMTLEVAQNMTFVVLIGLAAIYTLREFFAWVRIRNMTVLGELVARDLRNKVYSHLQKLSLSFFNSKQTGSIISRVGSDTDRIWDFIAFGVVEVTTSIIMLTGLSIVLIYLDWRLGLLVSLPVPLFLWIIYKHGQRMQRIFLRAWRKWSDLTDCLSDTIPGIKVVKSCNKEMEEVLRFQERNKSVVKEFINIHKVWTRFWPFLMLSIQGIVLSVWAFGMPRVLEHIHQYNQQEVMIGGLSPGVFISFVLYLGMFINPIEIIGQMSRMINRATSSAHRVFEILDTEPQITNSENAIHLQEIQGDIEFKNVVFSYDGIRKILKGVSFKIKAGEMIGLVGPSGSGKTTITNLIARFYEAQSGEILIDDHNLQKLDICGYRQQLGIVLQDPYLFHGTILENIRYAKPDATYKEVIESAKAANAHDFICKLPHAYDTIVGERGHSLSGGERQRVSIARAILRDPRILILDEATSSVDTETEKKIQQALDRLVKGRTTIAIAHRLSTLRQADRILTLKDGVLVEQGTHSELMSKDEGVYKKLVQMQQELHSNNL